MYSMVISVNNTVVHLKVAKNVHIKSSHDKKKMLNYEVIDVNLLW